MSEITITLNNDEVAIIDAALSLLHQNMVSQIGAIKEGIIEFGNDDEHQELLKGALDIKVEIEELQKLIEIPEEPKVFVSKAKRLKRRSK